MLNKNFHNNKWVFKGIRYLTNVYLSFRTIELLRFMDINRNEATGTIKLNTK